MGVSLPILFIIASLVLLIGVLSIVAILLVAKRCRITQNSKPQDQNDESDSVDPWREAGKRMKNGFDEPS